MRTTRLRIALLPLFLPPCLAQTDASVPVIDGYVTHIVSPRDFDINGRHIALRPDTAIQLRDATRSTMIAAEQLAPYLGETAKAYGKLDRKTHTISATRVELSSQKPHEISGSGIIDAILPSPRNADPTDRLIRADGYPVLLTSKTSVAYQAPLSSATPLATNLWITYHGLQRPDGIVVAETAKLTPNSVSDGEDRLRTKHEYDPEAVDPDAHQGALSKTFLGIDPKKIPPTTDTAMQARVSQLGRRLVPKYQHDLPDADDTKIDFRFQVVEQKKWPDAFTLPNGIILVPHTLVERMENDSQLATVLADNIATALEKQTLHAQPPGRAMAAANIAGAVGGAFVPGLGLATQAATGGTAYKLAVLREEQSGRVSLGLLQDAGFDIKEAPMTWWILSSKKGKSLADTNVPRRAAYLYKMLGTTWPSLP